ncbi:MAG TPA: DUF4221 family protein [Saprospiraceae bacterium]|nr:DUF4221 family protein [Saprospiraceae bacterium]
MNFEKVIFGISVFLFLLMPIACVSDVEKNQESLDNESHDVALVTQYVFQLDKRTPAINYNYQLLTKDESIFLAFYSPQAEAITVSNPMNTELNWQIKLERDGPDAVGSISDNDGMIALNTDSVYFVNTKSDIILLLDSNGHVRKRFNVNASEAYKQYGIEIIQRNYLANIVFKGNLLIPGTFQQMNAIERGEELPCVAVLDYGLSHLTWIVNLPEMYYKSFYSQHNGMYEPSFCSNSSGTGIIVSFPVSNKLYEYDLKGQLLQVHDVEYADWPEVTPYSYDVSAYGKDWDVAYGKYYLTTDAFGRILQLEGYYLREIIDRVTPDEYAQKKLSPKRYWYLLDGQFNVIKKLDLANDRYDFYQMFINDHNWGILRKDLLETNEDQLTFDVFAIN